jgi:hypothetical protein
VKNLGQVKVGDLVKVKYQESIAWKLVKVDPKEAQTKTTIQSTTVAPKGKKPAKKEFTETELIATITEIDKKEPAVTLKGPEGNLMNVHVQDPKNLEGVKVGDQVAISYTESLAVSVEKAK